MSAQLGIDFFNTVAYAGTDLASRKARAATQNATVLELFTAYGALTPSEVDGHLQRRGLHWEITSIRKAITTLTKERKLVKLLTYRNGPRGAREHVWALPAREVAA